MWLSYIILMYTKKQLSTDSFVAVIHNFISLTFVIAITSNITSQINLFSLQPLLLSQMVRLCLYCLISAPFSCRFVHTE